MERHPAEFPRHFVFSAWSVLPGIALLLSLFSPEAETSRDRESRMDPVTVYLTALDPQGKPMQKLTAGDFSLSDDGVHQTVAEIEEIDADRAGISTVSQRLFILHFPDDLDMHQEFRAKRFAKELARLLTPERDALSVLRKGAMSLFTQDREKMERLVDYFATEGDRYRLGPPGYRMDGKRPYWFCLENDDGGYRVSAHSLLNRALHQGNLGSFSTLLSGLRELPGRKILLHFGTGNPFQDEDPEYYEREAARRLVADAGITLFLVGSSQGWEDRDPGNPNGFHPELARDTGGSVIGLDDPVNAGQLLEKLSHYYRLRYRPTRPPDGRFHRIELQSSPPGTILAYRRGYFATISAATHLRARTFQTVLQRPADYSDFPMEIYPPDKTEDRIEVSVIFPFKALELIPDKTGDQTKDSRYFQRLQFFIAALDSSGGLVGYREGASIFQVSRKELLQMQQQRGRINETFEVEGPVARIVNVIVIGQNSQIASSSLRLGSP